MSRPLSAALQDHVVEWARQPWPLDWATVFGRQAPLALEIGFGNGDFLVEQALAHPERDHVGIELSWTAATHLFRRLSRTGCRNVRVLLGDAEAMLERLFATDALCEVFVNHPCPWPKQRHHERRLLRREFLGLLAARMAPGAPLLIVTDHAEYAAWLHGELAAEPTLASRHATVEVASIAGRKPTKYQKKAMAQGIPIHYFEWRKRPDASPTPRATPATEKPPMPTLTLTGADPERELFADFRPLRFRENARGVEVIVKFLAVYRRPDRPVWLIETFVQEDRLRQMFALDVVQRGREVLVKPSVLGEPYPTHGVKRAVWCAAAWLRARHPALVQTHESLGLASPTEPWPTAASETSEEASDAAEAPRGYS
jgi:tRNA (guanine-N7-)-methyltransferase